MKAPYESAIRITEEYSRVIFGIFLRITRLKCIGVHDHVI